MREVSCKATRQLLDALDEAGIVGEPLADGLGVPASTLRDPGARIDWDVFIELLARMDAACERKGLSLEELGERVTKVPSFELLRRAGQLLMTPRQLYDLANRFVAPALFANVRVTHEWLGSGRLVLVGEILPGYRASIPFFRVCHGNAAALPRVLDLPASRIEEQAFDGRRSRLVLLPPASHTVPARVARSARALRALGEVLRGIERHESDLDASLAALRTSRHEMQQLLARLPDAVIIHRGGVLCWANAAFAAVVGAERREDLVGRRLLDFVPPADREPLARAMQRAAQNEVADGRVEYRVLRSDGTLRRLQAGTAQLVELEGAPARMVVLRDVTEEHRLREQAEIADRLASLGALAAGVAHEINNPLTYIRMSLEIAAREAASLGAACGPDLRTALETAREGTERVLGIVRDLKVLSRVQDEPLDAVDLPALLDSTLTLAERAIVAKARLVRSYGPVPRALAIRGKLGQVFLNLLTNAADAIPEGDAKAHEIRVTTRTDAAGRAVVEIRDTGAGIAPEVAKRIFDPFFTTKPVGSGTGLGLAMCHRIVTELAGAIDFESAPGATTFRVTLPATTEAVPRRAIPQVPPANDAKPRARVLVVDDEPSILTSLRRTLEDRHDVVTASGAREALAILDGDDRFDAVLADLMMADATGIDLYEAVHDRRPDLAKRFVFMTGGAFSARARSFLAAVPNRCLEKPFERDELVAALDGIVQA